MVDEDSSPGGGRDGGAPESTGTGDGFEEIAVVPVSEVAAKLEARPSTVEEEGGGGGTAAALLNAFSVGYKDGGCGAC